MLVRHGSDAGLTKLLPGVTVHVLGPPSLEQSQKIKKQRSKDAEQFWQLLAGGTGLVQRAGVVTGLGRKGKRRRTFPPPPEARWFRDRLDRVRGDQLLQIVRTLDAQMNNTSVILLFEVGNKKLLFPGDAQIENWSYALEDAPNSRKTRALLSEVDFYKVGHHGSLNATPKKLLWENFRKKGKKPGHRMTSMVSTMKGKHGNTKKNTEVPRRTLLEALKTETDLSDTHDKSQWKKNANGLALKVDIAV